MIDLGKGFEESSDYALEENEISGWSRFLREPDSHNIIDPFPVALNDFENIASKKVSRQPINVEQFYTAIIHAIQGMQEFSPEVFYLNREGSRTILIDPALHNKRKQPVVIELLIDHIGSSINRSIVYTIAMKTPIASASQYKQLSGCFSELDKIQANYFPEVKLCLDVSQIGGSFWGIYVKAELPLFSMELRDNWISIEEVQVMFKNLVISSDTIEREIFKKDLTKDDLIPCQLKD